MEERRLGRFGEYLKSARLGASIPTQQAAAQALADLGRKVSQGLIAQYETGRIADPDPATLRLLARAYGKDYMELVSHLVRDKYEETGLALQEERWLVWDAVLKKNGPVGGVEGLASCQLRAIAQLLTEREILTVGGVIQWGRCFPDLRVMWVLVPKFLDNDDPAVFDSVVYNVKERDVTVVYFIPRQDMDAGGEFWRLEKRLAKAIKGRLKTHINRVPLDEKEVMWLQTDHVIANPHLGPKSMGFQYIRGEGRSRFAIRMDNHELTTLIGEVTRWAPAKTSPETLERILGVVG